MGDDLRQRAGCGRGFFRGLQNHAVAIGQRRRNFPGRHRHRKIPRGDHGHHADRFAGDFNLQTRTDRGHQLSGGPQHLGGVVAKELAGAEHLAFAFRQGLALLPGHQQTELIGAGA